MKQADAVPVLFTIGYEGVCLDDYLQNLLTNQVRLLIDVRHNPFSRKRGFSKKALALALQENGVAYMHLPELGIASEKRKRLVKPEDFKTLFHEYEKMIMNEQAAALGKLIDLLNQFQRVALTCFEADPDFCHRSHIVKVLGKREDFTAEILHLQPGKQFQLPSRLVLEA
jgi:uncharacterized protein (DUF488 family)